MPFNQFGEIIPDLGNSGGRNKPTGRDSQNNFGCWWIIIVIIVVFIGYLIVSNLNNKQVNSTQVPATTVYSAPSQVAQPPIVDSTPQKRDTVKKPDTTSVRDSLSNTGLQDTANSEIGQESRMDTTVTDFKNPYVENEDNNGQITIYRDCSNCRNVQVYVDHEYLGTLTKYFPYPNIPICGNDIYGATIVKNFSVGNHYVTGKDDYGNTWSGFVYIEGHSCKTYLLQNFRQNSVNSYPKRGNISFWTANKYIKYISIDGRYYGALNKYFYSKPSCGQFGTLSVTLSQGNHIVAVNNGFTKSTGSISVVAGECSLVEIK